MSAPALAEPTEVVVRVISQDAKFVGDQMGGARIVLRDAESGNVLADWITAGGTGNTRQIMESTGRSPMRATPDAAAFSTQLDLSQPTRVTAEVFGPLAQMQASSRVTSQRWIVPGQPVTSGDGWVVELPGLAVNIIAPQPNTHSAKGSRTIEVMSSTMLMCGCPITSGGLWDAKDYKVEVTAYQVGRKIASGKLDFIEAPGRYGGDFTLPTSGVYELIVSARNTRTGNAGVDRTSVIIPEINND
ncbi:MULTISPECIES: hypothetical protein [unclassified Parasphingorhabdus]|uniref:hypothetical protein n=1 Tax=Parasphingorhabdus sp. TaxID=2709688 RepID=UPI003BAF9580